MQQLGASSSSAVGPEADPAVSPAKFGTQSLEPVITGISGIGQESRGRSHLKVHAVIDTRIESCDGLS